MLGDLAYLKHPTVTHADCLAASAAWKCSASTPASARSSHVIFGPRSPCTAVLLLAGASCELEQPDTLGAIHASELLLWLSERYCSQAGSLDRLYLGLYLRSGPHLADSRFAGYSLIWARRLRQAQSR